MKAVGVLDELKRAISNVGIKEVARRSGLAASTISRVNSGQISPSLEVAERISDALGFALELRSDVPILVAPRLSSAKRILGGLKDELRKYGVSHAVIFGSVARGEDRPDSDIDVYLDFGSQRPKTHDLLKAEGRVIEVFGENKVDILSWPTGLQSQKLIERIKLDGVRVF